MHGGVSQCCDQGLGPTKRTLGEAVANTRAIDSTPHHPRLLENLEVLGDRRLGQWELVDDLSAKALPSPGEKAENLHPGGMPESLCEQSQLFVGLVPFDRS